MKNTIIHLIGYAGVGKLTIAQEISVLSGAIVVDNHLINNPIFSVIAADGVTPLPDIVWTKVAAIREAVFSAIEEISLPDFSFIFTNELYANRPRDTVLFNQLIALANSRGSLFVPVQLICDAEEHYRRVSVPERASKHKETSIVLARTKYASSPLFKPNHPNFIELNVTQLTAKQSANKILEMIKNSK